MAVFSCDAWLGGYYELAVELGPPSDERLAAALAAIWEIAGIEGCYLCRDVEPEDQPRVGPRLPGGQGSHLYGVATLANGSRVPCCTVIVREEDGADWLDFCLPLGGLGQALPNARGYPFSDDTGRSWRQPLDDWLAEIGRHLFEQVPFRLGLIGFEQSGMDDANRMKSGPPEERWVGYLWPQQAKLTYLPANRW